MTMHARTPVPHPPTADGDGRAVMEAIGRVTQSSYARRNTNEHCNLPSADQLQPVCPL